MGHIGKRESNQDIAVRNPHRKQDGIKEGPPKKHSERTTRERGGKRKGKKKKKSAVLTTVNRSRVRPKTNLVVCLGSDKNVFINIKEIQNRLLVQSSRREALDNIWKHTVHELRMNRRGRWGKL